MNPFKNFMNTWDEWHVFLIGFFSVCTGQKFWQHSAFLKPMVENEAWYYGLGRFIAVQYIIVLSYVMIRSIV